ncbi:hypothetical protein A3K34_01220 [candidate division WWE3 bacterium RIFOXYC1_FULL_40_10]|uniref:SipW-cognate class signal peptide n=1 Tax=candidate division WWE3 bacterium RIFOXYA2_FULL_46_9 TaxID=1802636 RepID=A0A1F4W1Y3_UNCKA|nr:MAG: hypothetical protein A3K58_01220 [candidate division WWE3 bacterium RIFOXYB1_FULL_40_22]OGC61490.1 MAG: hypothetical protein A3K37_01220 [candidate division WWE3 bacterium RIFOXYA1_FULL_40_11]OGC63422.1 MAG: hypothetical protein A2264_01700 [candidate division WWE3 bacterium RIFOXYA2_FULL_46_9]OGC64548.1 MAG: hypothetical protein A2326_03545 [candidate division WWE3 bacterium RIFOXYB2_FULL_41_6]OGC65873.1 MAG: hypothetical protein A3K34_01220 [candidate division WWE3 bacterium RIFOXYC1_
MRKLLTSLTIVSLLAAVTVLGTVAYFSDTEQSTDNTIQAGTIDIAVDNENPWTSESEYVLSNMMPGGHEQTIEFTVKNVGTNPLNIRKQFKITAESTGTESEPECTDQSGVWTNPSGPCVWGSATDANDISKYVTYSMTSGGVTVIDPAWELKLGDIEGLWVPVAALEPGASTTIVQSYNLDPETGNAYQGDEITFDIVLYAEQYMGTGPSATTDGLVLENKEDTHWTAILDGTWGLINWDQTTGNYTLRAWGLDNTKTYRLAYFGTSEVGVSGYVAPTAGALTISGTYPAFETNAAGAKYWLRPNDWSQPNTLWEANLVNPGL